MKVLVCILAMLVPGFVLAQTPISGLPAATTSTSGVEVFPAVQSSETVKMSLAQVLAYELAQSNTWTGNQVFSATSGTSLTVANTQSDVIPAMITSTQGSDSAAPLLALQTTASGGFAILSIAAGGSTIGTSDLSLFQNGDNQDASILNRSTTGTLTVGTGGGLINFTGGGVTIGSPSGGSEGAGTLNTQGCFINGIACLYSGGPGGTPSAIDLENASNLPATALPSSGVTAGSYTGADITVDQYGRLTAASNGSGTGCAGANPTATIGLTAVDGSSSDCIRSDGAPALSQAIVPTWTGMHTFAAGLTGTLTGHASLDLPLTGGTVDGNLDILGNSAFQPQSGAGTAAATFYGVSGYWAALSLTDGQSGAATASITDGYCEGASPGTFSIDNAVGSVMCITAAGAVTFPGATSVPWTAEQPAYARITITNTTGCAIASSNYFTSCTTSGGATVVTGPGTRSSYACTVSDNLGANAYVTSVSGSTVDISGTVASSTLFLICGP